MKSLNYNKIKTKNKTKSPIIKKNPSKLVKSSIKAIIPAKIAAQKKKTPITTKTLMN
jgi:hypothetical protein